MSNVDKLVADLNRTIKLGGKIYTGQRKNDDPAYVIVLYKNGKIEVDSAMSPAHVFMQLSVNARHKQYEGQRVWEKRVDALDYVWYELVYDSVKH